MFVLRRPQVQALVVPQREIFVRNALVSLAKLFPEDPRVADEPATRALIEDAILRAKAYEIASERELLLFLYLVFDQGPGFEMQPGRTWIAKILRDSTLDQHEKMDVVYARLELAQKARAR